MRQSSYTRETFKALKMRKKLTIFVDGPYGIAEGKTIWMVEKDIVFWCREEQRLGSRPRARVDIGTGKQVDIEIHVREHLVPEITQIPKGFVFVGRYSMVSKADWAGLQKVLRRINPDLDVGEGSMSGSGSFSDSRSSGSRSSMEKGQISQSFDSASGLQKRESQELLLWHLGRRKMGSKKTRVGGAKGAPGEARQSGSPIGNQDTPAAPEPTDPAERMRVAREALKETAGDRRPLFDSQDDMGSTSPSPDGEAVGISSQQSGSFTSSELTAPAQKAAKRARPLPGIGKAPPRKGKAHQALSDSVDILRARATGEGGLSKKATESSSFGFKRDFTAKKKKRSRKRLSPAKSQAFTTYVTGTMAPGTASVLIQFTDPGKLLACMRKQGSKLWFSVHLDQPLVVGTTLQILLKLPDSSLTQFEGRICEVHDTHSVLAVDNAEPTQIEAIRSAMELD